MTQEYAQQQRIVGGRYAIIQEIGRGGMGVVWLADDRTIGRRVAIKELHLPEGIDPRERYVYEERVLREARTAGRLSDPAIVTVFDVVQEQGNTFIVMEYIEAPTLADIVRQRGPISENFTARIAAQLVSALDTAHRAGIVHRDVKPSNVMIDNSGRVKLTDFGIAQSTEDPRLTTSGTLIGSPTYMSPERLKGQEAVPASDLWALGATLFYAVEGYGPYDRQTTAASIQAIMNEVAFLTRCRGPLASLIMGLLNSEPAGRPTATQVSALLGQATQSIPNTGPTMQAVWTPNPTTQPGGPAKSRKPLRIVLAALLAVVLLAAGWFGHSLIAGSGTPAAAPDNNAQQPMTYGEGGQIPVYEPYFSARQTCMAQAPQPQRQYKNVDQLDCVTKPHTTEQFAELRLDFKTPNKSQNTPGAKYPGADYLNSYGQAGCALIFNSEKVTHDKPMNFVALIPTEQAWNDPNGPARTIPCLAWTKDGGTVSGSIVVKDDN